LTHLFQKYKIIKYMKIKEMSARNLAIASLVITIVGVLSLSIALAITKNERGEQGIVGPSGPAGVPSGQRILYLTLPYWEGTVPETGPGNNILFSTRETLRYDSMTASPRILPTVSLIGNVDANIVVQIDEAKIILQPGYTYKVLISTGLRRIDPSDESFVFTGMYTDSALTNLYVENSRPVVYSEWDLPGLTTSEIANLYALGYITVSPQSRALVLYPGIGSTALTRVGRLGFMITVEIVGSGLAGV
jgi:hypothetical protein